MFDRLEEHLDEFSGMPFAACVFEGHDEIVSVHIKSFGQAIRSKEVFKFGRKDCACSARPGKVFSFNDGNHNLGDFNFNGGRESQLLKGDDLIVSHIRD